MKPDPDQDRLYCRCGWSMPIRGDQFRITLQEDLPKCPRQRWWNWPLHRTMVYYKPWTVESAYPTAMAMPSWPDPERDMKRAMKELDDGIPATSPLRPAINELVRQQYLKDFRPAPELLPPLDRDSRHETATTEEQ